MPETPYALGWKPQLPDLRDDLYAFKADRETLLTLPPVYWPLDKLPPLRYQGNLGACVSFGVRYALYAADMAYGTNAVIEPSPRHIYYHGRELENTVNSDSGLTIRDGFKAINKYGYCHEPLCPYSDDGQQFKLKPSTEAETDAAKNKLTTTEYQPVTQDLMQIKAAIAEDQAHPRPVAFGFTCYNSIFSAPNGDIQPPGIFDPVAGGHCICLCGWDDSKQRFLVANWWEGWGVSGGFGTIGFNYALSRLASDFWRVIRVPVDDSPLPPSPVPPSPEAKTVLTVAGRPLPVGSYTL